MTAPAVTIDFKAEFARIRAARATIARQSSEKLAAFVLRDEQSGEPIHMGAMHRRFHRATDENDRVAWAAFVSSGKTSQTVAKVLHVLGTRPTARVLFVSGTGDQATRFTRLVKRYIESSPELHLAFPKLRPGTPWGDSEIAIQRPALAKDASLRAVGLGSGGVLGSRADLILIDDPCSLADAQSPTIRARNVELVRSQVLTRLVQGGGRVIVTATPWAKGDVLDVLCETPGFAVYKTPITDPTTGLPSWPERYTPEKLQALRDQLGPFSAARSLDLHVRADDEVVFTEAMLSGALEAGRGVPLPRWVPSVPQGVTVALGVDLAVSLQTGSDLTAIVAAASLPDGRRQLLGVESGRWTVDQIQERVAAAAKRLKASVIVVESNAAQMYVTQLLKQRVSARVIPWVTGSGERALPYMGQLLAAEMHNGRWIFPRGEGPPDPSIASLVSDLRDFSPNAHCPDRVAALLFARIGISRGTAESGRLQLMDR